MMRAGLLVPQGYLGEYAGWDPLRAWRRSLDAAELGARLGFDSIWTGEHVHTRWGGEQVLFEGFTALVALAQAIPKINVGFSVLISSFRNPALLAKMVSTLDVVSAGRLTVGLGIGWQEADFLSYGFDFPSVHTRLAMLAEHLEVITRLVTQGTPPITFNGRFAHTKEAVNNPRSIQRPRIPIMIGGHGQQVTFRLAARYADEINMGVLPSEMLQLLPMLKQRCLEAGRDPSTLAISGLSAATWPYHGLQSTGGQRLYDPGEAAWAGAEAMTKLGTRAEALTLWREMGCSRVICGVPGLATSDEPLYELVGDCKAAGVELVNLAASKSADTSTV